MNAPFKLTVYCEECGQIFWDDDLLQWARELQKPHMPCWFRDARYHEKETGHHVMVDFPNQTLPMKLDESYGVYY